MGANPRVQCAAAWGLLETPLGRIGLRWRGELVTAVELEPVPEPVAETASATGSAVARSPDCPGTGLASDLPPDWLVRQILSYCRQPNFRFSVATASTGTAFQRRVWQVIAAIPAGRTRTYSAIAAELGSSPRAVGGACRANPYPLLVPCHRVVAVNGLGGFAGDTEGRLLAFKRRLLAHEAVLRA